MPRNTSDGLWDEQNEQQSLNVNQRDVGREENNNNK